jgi:hypothetical protein
MRAESAMRLGSAGAAVVTGAMVAAAIGVIASHALIPGFARLTSDQVQTTSLGVATSHLPLLRGD